MVNLSALGRFGSREVRREDMDVATPGGGEESSTPNVELGLEDWDVEQSDTTEASGVLEGNDQEVLQSMGVNALDMEMGGAEVESEGAAYRHPGLGETEEEASAFPSFMGQPWRNIPEEERLEAWVWLRDWVDWLTLTYHVTSSQLTKCWYRHSDVVEILWAMANAEAKAWAEGTGAPTNMPLTSWQNFIPGCLSQIQGMVKACSMERSHKEEQQWVAGEHPFVRALDEEDWQTFITGAVRTLDGPVAGIWRAAVSDSEGNVVAYSDEFRLGDYVVPVQAQLGDVFFGYRGDSEPTAFVRVSGTDAQILHWQKKTDAGDWEGGLGYEMPGSVLSNGTDSVDYAELVDPDVKSAVGP